MMYVLAREEALSAGSVTHKKKIYICNEGNEREMENVIAYS